MFRLLGFDVKVESGFVVFMVLIVALYGNEFGIWLALGIFVFTLVHELGHALAARRAGADASISLGFLAGYAAYIPRRPISRARQAWISFAGPFTHIVVSCAVLLAMGANPLERSSFDDSAASFAFWWAGPAIGALNLIPVLPLDGGNIVTTGLDRIVPGHARRLMLWFSIAVTGGGAVWMFLTGYQGFGIFIAFLLITQVQMLRAGRPRPAARSVWNEAIQVLEAGKDAKARRMLEAALRHPQPLPAHGEIALDRAQATALVDLLGDPLPHGDPGNEFILANILLGIGRHGDAARYAAGSFERGPNTLSAILIARAAAAHGDGDTAVAWLRAAADAGTAPDALAHAIDIAPELIRVRDRPEVRAIRSSLTTA